MRLMPCKQAGCPEVVDGGGYCANHRRDNDHARSTAFYHTRGWSGRTGVAKAVKVRNPICQKLESVCGRLEQCHRPAYLVHHRISPRVRPDLALKVYDEKGMSNLIALCARCHPDSDGTPDWREASHGDMTPPGGGEFFVRTQFSLNSVSPVTQSVGTSNSPTTDNRLSMGKCFTIAQKLSICLTMDCQSCARKVSIQAEVLVDIYKFFMRSTQRCLEKLSLRPGSQNRLGGLVCQY